MKIKLITLADHEALANDLLKPLTGIFDFPINEDLNELAIANGWHCTNCKTYAMWANYSYLKTEEALYPDKLKTEIVANFPFVSD